MFTIIYKRNVESFLGQIGRLLYICVFIFIKQEENCCDDSEM